MQSRLRRAELRVGRIRRELLDAQMDLNNVEIQLLGNETQRAARKVAEGRNVAEEAYRAAHDQFGSDAPTLPDCLADDTSSAEEEDEEDEEEEEDEEDDGSIIVCNHDLPSDPDYDDAMDLDGVVPPIRVDLD